MMTTVLPSAAELGQDLEELADVVEVEAGRRLVEEVEGPAGGPPAELLGQLDALGLASGKSGRGLAETDVAEPDPLQRGQLALELGVGLEELIGVVDRHGQVIGDRLALVGDGQGLLVVALARRSGRR